MIRVSAIIFSRMSSTRLPGKALLPVGGVPLIERVIKRCKLIKGVQKVIVATSTDSSDDILNSFLKKNNFEVFRGSLNDVLDRAIQCARKYNIDAFFRVCGDRPLFSYKLAMNAIDIFSSENYDLITNTYDTKLYPGMTVELISTSALVRTTSYDLSANDKEHITTAFYKYENDFKIKKIFLKHDDIYKREPLAVDTFDDLKRIEKFFL